MKIKLLLAALMITSAASAKKVKFAVDMTGQVLSTFGQHVTGDFQTLAGFPGGDWASNTTPLTQEGSSNIYSIVVDIPAFAKYEYKFVNGDQFYEAEFVPEPSRVGYNFNDNRWIYVDSLADDTTFVGAILFGGNAPAGLNLLRTIVDMASITVSPSGVHLAGDFTAWDIQRNEMYSFVPGVYEIISYVPAGTYEYKFFNGSSIVDGEIVPGPCSVNSNRSITVVADTVLLPVCFGACTACIQGIAESLNSVISVYPNPSSDVVYINAASGNLSQLYISDASGRIVRTYAINSSEGLEVRKGDLQSGLYIIHALVDGVQSTGKLIFN